MSCGRWIPVLFVLAVIASSYTVFTLDFLMPMIESSDALEHERGIYLAAAFNTLYGLGMISFLRTVFDEPGRVPDSWIVGADDVEEASTLLPPSLPVLETKHDGSRRICRKSKPNVYKPDRSHFCRQLGRCVLKMDHFCPWRVPCRPPPRSATQPSRAQPGIPCLRAPVIPAHAGCSPPHSHQRKTILTDGSYVQGPPR
jgi:hypothetical protein